MTNDPADTPDVHTPETLQPTDAVMGLVRSSATRPPYDAVQWSALAERIVTGAEEELERRRGARRVVSAGSFRRGVGAWWQVTAGWARPAVAAAVVLMGVAAALVASGPARSTNTAGLDSATVAGVTTSSTEGVDALMLESPTGATDRVGTGSLTRDSLFSALVDGR